VSDPKDRPRDPIAAMLTLSVEIEQSPADAEAELRELGVDVDLFLARVRQRRAQEDEHERLAWLRAARDSLETGVIPVPSRYMTMDHEQLVDEFRRREQQAHAYFHKLERLTDDDLRSLLADLDELERDEEDPT